MAVVYTRVIVVMVSVLLLSWGSFANFNPASATTTEDKLRNLVDDIDADIGKISGTPLADKLEDARNLFLAALDELEKDPPDVTSAIANLSDSQKEIQVAIDDEGFSPIIGNILIFALEALKNKLSDSPPEDVPPVVPPVDDMKINLCHIPPGNPHNFHTILVSKNAMKAHLDHGDFVGECAKKHTDEVAKKIKDAKKKKNMKKTEFKENLKAFNELKKKFKNEFKEIKKEYKMSFKDIKSELKDEFKDFKKNQKEYEDYQKKLEELEKRVKDLILELKENFAYDQEHKAELKKELKASLYKEKRDLYKHEKQEKHKIDSKIASLSKSSDPQRDAKKYGFDFKNGKIKIAIKLSDVDPNVIEQIENLGTVTVKNDKHIQMIVEVDDIPKIRSLEGIEKIRPPFSAIQFEQTVSEGVYFINADLVQYAGITGKGIKVAVLDLAFTDIPKISDNIVEVKSFRQGLDFIPLQGNEGEAGHGTAVAEIITDVAPEVELYLYAIETDIEFTAAIDEAISKDVDIIAMSAGWPHFPTDGTSHITKKIEEAIANDITFVVPAGNFGDKHWEGTFVDSNLNGWHEFLDTDEGLSFNVTESRIAEQKPITANLLWDVGMSDVADFDLVLVDPLGQIVDYSANEQITKDDSQFEYIYHVPEIEGIYALGVVYAGDTNSPADIPDATIEIFTINDPLEHPIVFSSVSVPADADGAIVVGAVNHMDGELEPFSSQGPTNHGKLAPHVVGPDGVTTIALDGEPFFGTSATTPYIAGMAALLLEINPDITPAQLLTEIQENTVSNLVSLQTEYDNAMGYGQANAEFLIQMEVAG